MIVPLSILDLAPIRRGETASDSFAASVALARRAEEWGYRRVWYAEHHNAPSVASSATSVLIAHVAALTRDIRVGAGGIMLPNHAPLMIAEQFGTLEALHPGRTDLGLGRAPGADENTMLALRRDEASADRFPEDVLELQGYLAGATRIPGVDAIPGKGAHVPLYILGSSMFGARLAASLGLPYAFAAYRREFRPSEQLEQPYVIAGVNVIAADSSSEAQEQFLAAKRNRVSDMLGRGRIFTDEEADTILDSPAGQRLSRAARGLPGARHRTVRSARFAASVHSEKRRLRWRKFFTRQRQGSRAVARAVTDARMTERWMCNCARRRRWAAKGAATNPEQLFAVGYAACFESALGVVGRRERVEVGDVSIDSRVSLLPNGERGFMLAVALDVTLPKVQDPEQAARIVAAAHKVCPYSNATRGNIDVTLTANGQDIAEPVSSPRAGIQ